MRYNIDPPVEHHVQEVEGGADPDDAGEVDAFY